MTQIIALYITELVLFYIELFFFFKCNPYCYIGKITCSFHIGRIFFLVTEAYLYFSNQSQIALFLYDTNSVHRGPKLFFSI